jgi:23S rRNA (cytosine1962-C5)-methyltransferase
VSFLGASDDERRAALEPRVIPHPAFDDYALIDSGAGEKLERFGKIRLCRPDPQALWSRRLSDAEWARADLTFVRESDRGGRWEARGEARGAVRGESPAEARREPRVEAREKSRGAAHELARRSEPEWSVAIDGCRFLVRPTPFKHVGIFPEQAANWSLLARAMRELGPARPRLLNLFGYTGVASVIAARSGYDVTHVDASRASLAWTRDNLRASQLDEASVRIVLDDALAFAGREARRGARYDVVLLDPPHYGRGPKGEKWQFEDHIARLIEFVRELVNERALVIVSTYAIGTSPLTLRNLVGELGSGDIDYGELAIPESADESTNAFAVDDDDAGARKGGPRSEREARPPLSLPAGFCARWSRGLRAECIRGA